MPNEEMMKEIVNAPEGALFCVPGEDVVVVSEEWIRKIMKLARPDWSEEMLQNRIVTNEGTVSDEEMEELKKIWEEA